MIPSEAERLFLTSLSDIERIIRIACMRGSLSNDEAEDFASTVKLRLIEDNYAILRKYRARSSFLTFITIVVHRLLLDYRKHAWGRWHPSAEARRRGEMAVEAERIVVRDGRSIDEAFVVMQSRYPTVTRQEIERLAASFPRRRHHKMVELTEAADALHVAPREFAPERRRTAEHISTLFRDFLDNLSDEDRLVFHLRFFSDMNVAQIARSTHRDQKPLYRRMERLAADFRQLLREHGINDEDVLELLRQDPELLDFQWKDTDSKKDAP